MSGLPPRSAYIHVPFCIHRCGYCNFALVADRSDLVKPYLIALKKELEWLKQPRQVDTLYFGGGTPTFLTPDQLAKLCELALSWHPLGDHYEWTVEANPADLNQERLGILAHYGVNRLSLGAQSFNTAKLKRLERDHQASDIQNAIRLAREAGIRVSLDLIFAAPKETLGQWQKDLETVITIQPDHISTYGLTYEQGTTFWSRLEKHELQKVPEELEREMYLLAIDLLAEAGYEHYEISNFAKQGQRSRHNEAYWNGKSYFAAGPGAARYVEGVRSTNHRSTVAYLKLISAGESPVAEQEQLNDEQRAREMLVFGLRRLAGISREAFQQQSGFEVDVLAGNEIAHFVELDLLCDDGQNIKLSREGLLLSDSLWPELL